MYIYNEKVLSQEKKILNVKRKGVIGGIVGISFVFKEIRSLIKSLMLKGIKGVEILRNNFRQLSFYFVKLIKGKFINERVY